MGRPKNTPKKRNVDVDYRCHDYIPVVKKRKRKTSNNKAEKYFNISSPTDLSKQYYLGQLLLGPTNNIFPQEYKKVQVSFRFSGNNESEQYDDDNDSDAIVIDCDKVLVVVESHVDAQFIKELVSRKVFTFDFVHTEENVYLKIYFEKLPLPTLFPKFAKHIKTLFSLFFNEACPDKDESQQKHQGNEVTKLYENLTEIRQKGQNDITKENVQHNSLRPILRPYQEKSVQWMLLRERIEDYNTDVLHPLYTQIKLESGSEIYFDKYTGYVTSEKPLVYPTSKGGILADEMGLGKTVEVLACILLNPKPITKKIKKPEEDSNTENVPVLKKQNKKQRNYSNDESKLEPLIKYQKQKYVIEDSDDEFETGITSKKKRQSKRLKVQAPPEKNDLLHKSTEIKIPGSCVKSPNTKSANKIALETWYNSILSNMSTVSCNSNKGPDRISIQCICGNTSEVGIIKCTKCPKYQHKECMGYKKTLGAYICPQCWMNEPLLESKATLIVTPMALKTQWCKEICRHVKGKLIVLQYEGHAAVPVYPTELKEYDIVLTTYAVLQQELRFTENGQVFNLRRERKYSPPGSPLTRLKWWRLCLDEAQTVDTPGRMVSEMAGKINAIYRWAVTGTPISKNISDLQGLIDYLQITPYNELTTWNKILYEPYLTGNEEPLLKFLSEVLWRTAKKDVSDQINIPKTTHLEHTLEFSAVEKYFYKREHELICNDFISKVTKFDLSIHLEDLDRSTLKKLLAPLLTLRHTCTHPNTVRGRYLATKKQVTSMKELLNALILKNTNDSEDCLRFIISSLNGISGIHLLLQDHQEAINSYRKVLQLAARFSGDKAETKLSIDKPQVIHTLYNLAEVLDIHPPDQPTLRDENLRRDCVELEKKYMEKFINESISAFESFSVIMMNVEKMQNNYTLKEGQWYSDGLNWILINDHFDELQNRVQTTCDNASVQNTLRTASERVMLQHVYLWNDDISELRSRLFESIENIYDYEPESLHKIVIKEGLVTLAMQCHLRPEKKGKQAVKCPVCIANDNLKKYEGKLFGMVKREKTFEEMSLKGSWKPTLQELVMKAILVVLRAKNFETDFIKDGELHITVIENFKKEFKELRRLWTFLDQQICAKDELDICKVRLQIKTDEEEEKVSNALKNLAYNEDKRAEIHLLSVHELDYQMSLLENEVKQNSAQLEKLLGTQSYLDTLRKQQYEGQSPDPCPICKNTLEQHWSILLCGHSYCLECIEVLLEQTLGDHIQCSICRNKQKYQEISYIKAGNTVKDDDTKNIQGNYSTKIEGIIKLLLDLKNENADVKVLLFSDWTTVLKSLKEALEKNSISCELVISGNMDTKITNFKDPSKNITALLLPIYLGSKGLNLIEATHVILVEPLLNPADELQAIGRVSRIGQTKATFVHKFLIKNTIEENIRQATTSNAENWEKSRVTLQHLVDLFNTTELADTPILETSSSEEIHENNVIESSFIENEYLEPSVSTEIGENPESSDFTKR